MKIIFLFVILIVEIYAQGNVCLQSYCDTLCLVTLSTGADCVSQTDIDNYLSQDDVDVCQWSDFMDEIQYERDEIDHYDCSDNIQCPYGYTKETGDGTTCEIVVAPRVQFQQLVNGSCADTCGQLSAISQWSAITSSNDCQNVVYVDNLYVMYEAPTTAPHRVCIVLDDAVLILSDLDSVPLGTSIKCVCTPPPCLAGTYASGTAVCDSCPTACDSCPSGTYSIADASSCSFDATSCPAGTYASGTAACDSCPSGKYNDQPGRNSESVACKECGTGKYNDQAGQPRCKECDDGEYNDLDGGTSCKNDCLCPYFITMDATDCIDSRMYKERTSGQCGDSGDGWGKITSSAACEVATLQQMGVVANAGGGGTDGMGVVENVGGGGTDGMPFWGRRLSQKPPGCVIDVRETYTRYQGMDPGSFPQVTSYEDSGSANCSSYYKCLCTLVCKKGTYQNQLGESRCEPASAGSYVPTTGQTSPTACAEGTYQNQPGQSRCTACAEGKFNNQPGQTLCVDASAGYYVPTTGQTSQTACAEGMYQNQPGQSSCNYVKGWGNCSDVSAALDAQLTVERVAFNARLTALTSERVALNARLTALTSERDALNARLTSAAPEVCPISLTSCNDSQLENIKKLYQNHINSPCNK